MESSAGNGLENSRAGSEFQVRVPIVQRRFTADARGVHGDRMSRVRRGEGEDFAREQTLTTLYTSSDIRANGIRDSAGRKASGGIGVAK